MDKNFLILTVIFAIVRSLWLLRSSSGSHGSSWPSSTGRTEQIFDESLTERVRFDASGWTFASRDGKSWLWCDALGNVLGLQAIARNLGPVAVDGDVVSYCRENVAFGSSLVEARPVHAGTFRGHVSIEKRARPPGYSYIGRLHVMLEHQTVVFWIQALEHGVTGVREAVVVAEALKEGRISIPAGSPSGTKIPGWFVDPYDPTRNGRTICSIADEQQYDGKVPGHPLSRIRQTMAQIEASFELRDASQDSGDPWPYPPLTASDEQPRTIH